MCYLNMYNLFLHVLLDMNVRLPSKVHVYSMCTLVYVHVFVGMC